MKYPEIIKTKWFLYHLRERTPLLMYIFTHGSLVTENPILKEKVERIGNCMDRLLGGKYAWDSFGEYLWKAYLANPRKMLSYMRSAFIKHRSDQKKWKKMLEINYKKLDNKELLKYYGQYIDSAVGYGGYTFVPLAMEKQLTDFVLDILHKKFSDQEQYYENLITTPQLQTSVVLDKVSLLELAVALKKKPKNFGSLLDKHVENFGFLKSKGMFLDFYDREYFLGKLKNIKSPSSELKKMVNEQKKREVEFKKMLKKLKRSEQIAVLTLNDAIYFRSWRTEVIDQSSFYIKDLFSEIAERLKLNFAQDAPYLYPDEVVRGLNKKISQNKLADLVKNRRLAFGHMRVKGKEYKIDGQEAVELLKKLDIETQEKKELIGKPAFKGKVVGRVALILKKTDYPKIVDTDILVATSTMPDMVPYMRKIKAIVTEEGGVLSHASVISRELKIPAVIGVAGVTNVLKDGDKIEVDAISGVIRKI